MLKKYISLITTPKYRMFWVFFAISIIIFFLWILAFWPGIMTPDSLSSWDQIIKGSYYNAHPYIYTIYIRIITSLYFSPVSVAIFQILLTSFLGSFVFYKFYLMINKKWIVWVAFLGFIFSVPIGLHNIAVWKDTIYSTLIVFWAIFIYFFIKEKKIIKNYYIAALLGFLVFFTSTVRHNGIIFLLIIPLFFLLNKLTTKKALTIITLVSLIFYGSSQLILPKIINVNMKQEIVSGIKLQLIASVLSSNNINYNEEKYPKLNEINQLISIGEIKRSYTCLTVDSISANKNLRSGALYDAGFKNKFNRIFTGLMIGNLPKMIGDRACIITSIFLGDDGSKYYNSLENKDLYSRFPNNLNIKQEIKVPWLRIILLKIAEKTATTPYNLVARSLLIPLLFYLFVVSRYYKKNKAMFNYSLFLVIQLPVILLVLPAGDFRYLYFLHLGFFFLIPMFFTSKIKNKKGGEGIIKK